MYFLIAGYNTMSEKEKNKYNVDGLATVMWNGMLGMAVLLVIGYFAAKLLDNPQIETYVMFGALIIGIPYILIKSNSGKYKNDNVSD
ncbi:DUF3784 domain-containing protein [Cellulophaga sp. 20_2_10]|nr:DUF3784 domain-containing protein [Cellulophaga sp. 20_2_10]